LSEPDEIRFACIGCGTYNPANAEVCAGCGHRFAGPDVIAKVRVVLPPRPSENPYEPPSAPIAPPRTFRIGSLLVWIALIAVCLGAFRENIALGILATISFVPPAIWTSIRSGSRRAEGRPMNIVDQLQTFSIALFGTWGIVFSSSVAFCVTCFGAGITTNSFGFALALGVVVAVGIAAWLTHLIIKNGRDWASREREIRYPQNPYRNPPGD
jgi:hypothetical protein